MNTICRPEKITCRWLSEMTRALQLLDQRLPAIELEKCKRGLQLPEEIWVKYAQQHRLTQHPQEHIRQILAFEKDYHDVLAAQ